MQDYSAILDVARGKLQKTEGELPDALPELQEEVDFLLPTVMVQVPGLGTDYTALTGSPKTLLDGAIGRLVAARLRPVLQAALNNGAGVVVESKIGDVEKRFAAQRGTESGSKTSIEGTWIDEANEALSALSALLAKNRIRRTNGTFCALPGRRRAVEAQTGYHAADVRDLLLLPTRFVGRASGEFASGQDTLL